MHLYFVFQIIYYFSSCPCIGYITFDHLGHLLNFLPPIRPVWFVSKRCSFGAVGVVQLQHIQNVHHGQWFI
jgi:hypothetical protein